MRANSIRRSFRTRADHMADSNREYTGANPDVPATRAHGGQPDMPPGMLGSVPLRPSPPVPTPVISPSAKAALAKYPAQAPEIRNVVKRKGW